MEVLWPIFLNVFIFDVAHITNHFLAIYITEHALW